jgi:hypothetical protein
MEARRICEETDHWWVGAGSFWCAAIHGLAENKHTKYSKQAASRSRVPESRNRNAIASISTMEGEEVTAT